MQAAAAHAPYVLLHARTSTPLRARGRPCPTDAGARGASPFRGRGERHPLPAPPAVRQAGHGEDAFREDCGRVLIGMPDSRVSLPVQMINPCLFTVIVNMLTTDRASYESKERAGLGAGFLSRDPEIDNMSVNRRVSLEHFYDHANAHYNMSR